MAVEIEVGNEPLEPLMGNEVPNVQGLLKLSRPSHLPCPGGNLAGTQVGSGDRHVGPTKIPGEGASAECGGTEESPYLGLSLIHRSFCQQGPCLPT